MRERYLKDLEGARRRKQIGKAVEAQVKVTASEPVYLRAVTIP